MLKCPTCQRPMEPGICQPEKLQYWMWHCDYCQHHWLTVQLASEPPDPRYIVVVNGRYHYRRDLQLHDVIVDPCPFCGRKHTHTWNIKKPDGGFPAWRRSHCDGGHGFHKPAAGYPLNIPHGAGGDVTSYWIAAVEGNPTSTSSTTSTRKPRVKKEKITEWQDAFGQTIKFTPSKRKW